MRGAVLQAAILLLVVVVSTLVSCAPEVPMPPGLQDAQSLSTVPPTPAPREVRLPEDDSPHDMLTEWWYYTGHLRSDNGHRYGFEFVVFQSIRGRRPVGYLSHFAVTDLQRRRFRYAARGVQRSGVPPTLDLDVDGWRLVGGGGHDRIVAVMDEYGVELELAPQKPPVLHYGGLVSFGPAGDSYYYSRTRLAVGGRFRDGENWLQVSGQAWFDHQWGNFIVPAVGGWDWFSVQLDDGRELMVSLLRDANGARSGAFGTWVDQSGSALELPQEAISVVPLGYWSSTRTGATYPSGWQLRLESSATARYPAVDLRLDPLLEDQELGFDRMPYWEGAVEAFGTVDGASVKGEGYVELTGYGQ